MIILIVLNGIANCYVPFKDKIALLVSLTKWVALKNVPLKSFKMGET